MSKDQTITATEASRGFSELLHRVCYGGETFVIRKGQRLMARIAPMEPVENTAAAATEVQDTAPAVSEEPLSPNMATDEAEFYRAWMEQVKKVELNDSPIDI